MKTKNIFRVFLTAVFVLGTMVMNAQTKVYVYNSGGTVKGYDISTVDSISFTAPDALLKHLTPAVDITSMLKNTQSPFDKGDYIAPPDPDQANVNDRWYMAKDWITNEAGSVNGNLDCFDPGGYIGFEVGWGSQGDNIVNGKLYQTIELQPGYYRFDAHIHGTNNWWSDDFENAGKDEGLTYVWMVANTGTDLPDIGSIPAITEEMPWGVAAPDIRNLDSALGFLPVPYLPWQEPWASEFVNPVSLHFTVYHASTVSIGFVTSLPGWTYVLFDKVELWQE